MLLDAGKRDASWPSRRVYDVCIAGAGPAGITLARKLAAGNRRVALLEAGGFAISAESQDCYAGDNVGHDYFALDTARLRYFGGTSNHWEGWCIPLTEGDFRARAVNPASGWPIGKADLDPFAAETREILALEAETPEAPDPLRAGDGPLVPIMYDFSRPPVRFGEKYRKELEQSRRIDLIINANLVDIRLAGDGAQVEAFVCRTLGDPTTFEIAARSFALCCGGIENPRLLLNFDRQARGGIGNGNDLVGRFFCEHPAFTVGSILYDRERSGDLGRGFYAPSEELMASAGILDFALRVPGTKGSAPWYRSMARRAVCSTDFGLQLYQKVTGEHVYCDASTLAADGDGTVPVVLVLEQQLDPASRVLLGDERDELGLRRVKLDWRLGDLDRHTMRTAITELGKLMIQSELGRVRITDWLMQPDAPFPDTSQDIVAGFHHMCTTRMSASPTTGVVDPDCKVFGIDNLYVGGSSVFANGGAANPTYTIVQLALRLARHLDKTIA